MSHGAYSIFVASMASGGTLTSAVDLQKAWNNVYLSVHSMTSNTQMHLQAAGAGVTFRRVKQPVVNTTTVAAPTDFAIHSSATNCMVPLPQGFRYVKIETTATVDGGGQFIIICGD